MTTYNLQPSQTYGTLGPAPGTLALPSDGHEMDQPWPTIPPVKVFPLVMGHPPPLTAWAISRIGRPCQPLTSAHGIVSLWIYVYKRRNFSPPCHRQTSYQVEPSSTWKSCAEYTSSLPNVPTLRLHLYLSPLPLPVVATTTTNIITCIRQSHLFHLFHHLHHHQAHQARQAHHSLLFLHPHHSLLFLHPRHSLLFLHPCHSLLFLRRRHSLLFLHRRHSLLFLHPRHSLVAATTKPSSFSSDSATDQRYRLCLNERSGDTTHSLGILNH